MTTTKTEETAVVDPKIIVSDDPRINGKHPSMVPGHPECNYEKFMAAQRKVTVVYPSDQRNPHYTTIRLSFNGSHSIEIPFDRPVPVPLPYAELIVLGAKGTCMDEALVASLKGQMSIPPAGQLRGPLSQQLPDEQPL